MTKIKRMAAAFLALILCLSLIPAALASGEPEETPETASDSVETILPEEETASIEATTEEETTSVEATTEEETSSVEATAEEETASVEATAEEEVPDESSGEPEGASYGDEEETASEEPAEEEEEVLTPVPASDGESSLPSDLYLVQERRGWCTLASATMMIRARMFLSGNASWSSVTQTGAYSSAWLPGAGLYFNFTYTYGSSRVTVSHNTVSGFSVEGLKALLDKHPEGIVLYVYDVPHAIFVTDYEGDTFYGSDPANASGRGRRPIADTWLASQLGGTQRSVLNAADAYWYVASYSIKATTWYTVSFDANGGVCGETSRTVAGGSAVGALPTPTRTGYVFAGWYTDAYGGSRVYDSTAIVATTKLYARWTPVKGTLSFSVSPLTINLARGAETGTVTVQCSGDFNSVRLQFKLDEGAEGALSAAWSGEWDGVSRPVTFRAESTESGSYTATFYLYDADTDALLDTKVLTINVINADISLRVYDTNVVVDVDETGSETVYIFCDGNSGKLPDGYKVKFENRNPYAVSCELGEWNGEYVPLVVSPNSSWVYGFPCSAVIVLTLVDPEGEIWSEISLRVTIVRMYGECGDNVLWDFNGVTLHIYLADENDPDGFMWNYEIGDAPWYAFGDSIRLVTIERGVTRVGTCAFANCTALHRVNLCDTLTEIGRSAFSGCTDLAEVTVPGSVKIVDTAAFYGCMSLVNIAFGEGTERVAPQALGRCSSLKTVTLPASLSEFSLTSRLGSVTDVYYGGSREQWDELNAACAITEMLPSTAVIHTARTEASEAGGSDAARILQYAADPEGYDGLMPAAADADGDGEVTWFDAAQVLRQLVGIDA